MFKVKPCLRMKIVALFLVLILFFCIPDASSDNVPQCDRSDKSNPHRYDPLACWLWNMQVGIPNQSFRESFVTVDILDMHCTNFTMTSIDSSYRNSSDGTDKNPAILLAVSGISATCIGRYHVTGGIGGSVQAWVKQQGNDNTHSLGLSLEFVSVLYENKIRMATSVLCKDCQAQLQVSSLHFGGSISARLINLFKSSIQNYVSNALSTSLCPALEPPLSDDLTKAIQAANQYLKTILPKNISDVVVKEEQRKNYDKRLSNMQQNVPMTRTSRKLSSQNNTTHSVDWKTDTPTLYKALEWTNALFYRYLDKGFLVDAMGSLGWNVPSHINCGAIFRGINGLLHSLTHGHVVINIPKQIQNMTIVIPHYGRVQLSVEQIQLAGIDKWTDIGLLQPTANDMFQSKLSTNSNFNLTVAMNVEVTSIDGGLIQGDALQEAFVISLDSTRGQVGGFVSVNYNKRMLGNVHMHDIIEAIQNYKNKSQWSCLLAPLQSLNVSDLHLDASLSQIVVTPTGSTGTLEKDMDAMLNTFLQLFLTEYHVLMHEALIGLVQGPTQSVINVFIQNWIKEQSTVPQGCRAIPSGDIPDFVRFNELSVLRQWNRFLNQSLESVNEYLGCVADAFNQSMRPVSLQVENVHVNVTELSVPSPGCIHHLGKNVWCGADCAASHRLTGIP